MRTSALVSWLFFYSNVATVFLSGQCQSDQQELLLGLKNSLNSSSSEKLVKWDQYTDCCSWDGITCDADGQVIGLDLSNQSTSGAIDESNSLFHLLHLQQLNLDYNSFKSTFPSGFENLANLRYLNLSNAGFTGQILVEISYMTKLVILDLSKSWLRDIGSLKLKKPNLVMLVQNLTRLQNLYLEGINIAADRNNQSLREIYLSQNQFIGGFSEVKGEFSSLLEVIDLSQNRLQWPFLMFLFEIQGLHELSLSCNKFSGLIPRSVFHKLKNRTVLDLSYNNLHFDSSFINLSLPPFLPNLAILKLASCNLTKFSDFLKNLSILDHLDLSNNRIHGKIPKFERPSYITSPLAVIDLHGNQLQGQKPIFPPKVVYLDYSSNNFSSVLPHEIGEFLQLACFFSLSRNNFHGSIPKSICQGSSLLVLDLSNNSLSGSVPECLIQMSVSLGVLNLKRNNLSSNIPDTFPENYLRNNQIDDTFHCHLKSTSRLRVLVLRSNKFKRDVNCRENITWLMLQIIDLASNSFGGKLPHGLLMTWNAMMTEKDEPYSEILHFQFLKLSELSFLDSMTVTMKGLKLELVKILTIFTSIDFSSNKFEGPIPEAIGDFRVLYLLNFSNNALTGTIPSFLGNLLKLEALDLSSNHLIGQIPLQLANLNFLSFLNLSNNELIGKIPLGTQIQSFPEASFENNARLCGLPLKALCESPAVTKVDPSNPRTGNHINWNLISVEIGFVFGLRAGIVPLMFWKRWRIWYSKRIDRVLFKFFPKLDHRNRNHRTIAHWIQGRRL
ncbi:hypothetical protein GOBAR_AA32947 [Gossypium barbadense]|uniref:Leucine-rich repeat-containing N-terminal plant-type domain-containing protein n=1 Tax=Gossypium barbadense TaxID=3634 RepID=A0A2P5W9P8_GOSBA|nr:hypothetical protein GOBAR_AA32947 [Gossypium barbadense]